MVLVVEKCLLLRCVCRRGVSCCLPPHLAGEICAALIESLNLPNNTGKEFSIFGAGNRGTYFLSVDADVTAAGLEASI